MQRKAFIALLGIGVILTCSSGLNARVVQDRPKGAPDMVALLEKSGYSYSKVRDGVWEIPGTGKNLKEFGIRLALAEDVLLVMVRLADRKDVKLQPALMTRLLELNHKFDWIKLALSEDMLYLRMDTHVRLVDSQELKYLVEQIANATDETYPQIKQFVTGAK
ncbi:MAG TPA: YbjN domain-containing protein [Blastocatellia bacterium]|nr:YbjN domain-containing protein [Blastocatellia bacterium]